MSFEYVLGSKMSGRERREIDFCFRNSDQLKHFKAPVLTEDLLCGSDARLSSWPDLSPAMGNTFNAGRKEFKFTLGIDLS